MHRDVKVENLLLSKGGTAKLADFGVAYAIEDGIPSTCVGTLDYMAPEVRAHALPSLQASHEP